MREPTFSRSRRRTRQQRLLRTGAGVVVMVAIVAIGISLFGGDAPDEQLPTPEVAFDATFAGYGERRPTQEQIDEEGGKIVALLDDWYQQAFVDVDGFGDATFPEVASLFAEEARAAFTRDIAALTIGEAADEVSRVEPEESSAQVSVYFQDGEEPVYAAADVVFTATATMKDGTAPPLRIQQELQVFFTLSDGTWLVSTWYDATQRQDSIEPSPSPTGGSS